MAIYGHNIAIVYRRTSTVVYVHNITCATIHNKMIFDWNHRGGGQGGAKKKHTQPKIFGHDVAQTHTREPKKPMRMAQSWHEIFLKLVLLGVHAGVISFFGPSQSINQVMLSAELCSSWKRGVSCMSSFKAMAIQPDQVAWQMTAAACKGNWRWPMESLEQMSRATLANLDLALHTACVDCCRQGRQWTSALRLLEELQAARVAVDAACYRAAVGACAACGAQDAALSLSQPDMSPIDRTWTLARLQQRDPVELRAALRETYAMLKGTVGHGRGEGSAASLMASEVAACWWSLASLGVESVARHFGDLLLLLSRQLLPRCRLHELMLISWGAAGIPGLDPTPLLWVVQQKAIEIEQDLLQSQNGMYDMYLPQDFVERILGIVWSCKQQHALGSNFQYKTQHVLSAIGKSLDEASKTTETISASQIGSRDQNLEAISPSNSSDDMSPLLSTKVWTKWFCTSHLATKFMMAARKLSSWYTSCGKGGAAGVPFPFWRTRGGRLVFCIAWMFPVPGSCWWPRAMKPSMSYSCSSQQDVFSGTTWLCVTAGWWVEVPSRLHCLGRSRTTRSPESSAFAMDWGNMPRPDLWCNSWDTQGLKQRPCCWFASKQGGGTRFGVILPSLDIPFFLMASILQDQFSKGTSKEASEISSTVIIWLSTTNGLKVTGTGGSGIPVSPTNGSWKCMAWMMAISGTWGICRMCFIRCLGICKVFWNPLSPSSAEPARCYNTGKRNEDALNDSIEHSHFSCPWTLDHGFHILSPPSGLITNFKWPFWTFENIREPL